MASVIAGAAVGASNALQKMLESRRTAVLQQQRAYEAQQQRDQIRQQQQDLKDYRSQTIEQDKTRLAQLKTSQEAARELQAQLAEQADITDRIGIHSRAEVARAQRAASDAQHSSALQNRLETEYVEQRGLADRSRATYLSQRESAYLNEYGIEPSPAHKDAWRKEATELIPYPTRFGTSPAFGPEPGRTSGDFDPTTFRGMTRNIDQGRETSTVPGLGPEFEVVPDPFGGRTREEALRQITGGFDSAEEYPPPLSPTGGFNTRREEPYQPSPDLPGQEYLDLLRGAEPTVPAGQARPIPGDDGSLQLSPVQADPFGGLTQEAALQQITGLTQAQTQEPQQKLFEAPKWQPSPGVITPTPARPSHRIGTPPPRRTPPVSEAAQGGVGAAFRVSEVRQKRIDELLEWEADLLSGKRSGFAPGHKTSQESFNLWINAPLPGRGPKEKRERDKLRREYALQAVRRELNGLGARVLPDADMMPTPFDMNALVPTVPFEAPLYPSVETTEQAYDPATGKPIPGF